MDQLKLASDDSYFQPEHILFLLDKYRSFLLKQRYSDIKKSIPESNFQTICVNLENINTFENDQCGGKGYLRSIETIPYLITLSYPKISTLDYFTGNISYVNKERFKYVGNNKYLQNTIYGTIAPNEHLYLKSNNPQAYHLNKVKITGIFEDSAKASELDCNYDNTKECDVMEREFPLEEALISPLIELIVKALSGSLYTGKDTQNNATDDLSDIATFIRRNMKSDFQKKME